MIIPIISRRNLFVSAMNGAAAWLGDHLRLLTAQAGNTYSIAEYRELIALCSDLRCPSLIANACLLALPPLDSTLSSLVVAILADARAPRRSLWASDKLADAIKERSCADFREDRIVSVGGWILSLTEARVYALAGLITEPGARAA